MPPSYTWQEFLTGWSHKVIQLKLQAHLWDPQASAARWLGRAAAAEDQIRAIEAQLQMTLPPSYRTFLALTNGWSVLTDFVWRLYPVEEIGWYGPRYPDNLALLRGDFKNNPIHILTRMFGGAAPASAFNEAEIPVAQLESALEIAGGDHTDAVEYVLNPHVQTEEGEWEAWIIRWWKPLAMERYESFWELMQAEYRRLE
jgi:hypothetical protein